jgi:carboxyl-terminal processing protease
MPHRLTRSWFLSLAASAALLVGCAHERAELMPAGGGLFGEAVFERAYERIADVYLRPVDLGELAQHGIEGLKSLEPTIGVRRDAGVMRVSGPGGPFEVRTPTTNDPRGWGIATAAAVHRLRAASPALRTADPEDIYQPILDAVVADLDEYSRYANPRRAAEETAVRSGYGGIGITLEGERGDFRVGDVFDGGPADRAGLRRGDRILAVDGDPTAEMEPAELRDRLRGRERTRVVITVRRGADAQDVSVRRERVVPVSVRLRIEDGFAVVRIDTFNSTTAEKVEETVARARQELGGRLRGVVLDLRDNRGGLFDEAIDVADLFIRSGGIVFTAGRHPSSSSRATAKPDDIAAGLPLAVLVDDRSASSAEVVAAALQDAGRALVVGSGSFGKGSVQRIDSLPNGGVLYLTWSRIYVPSGFTFHRQGVVPHVCTSREASGPDAVLAEVRSGLRVLSPTLAQLRHAAADDDGALAAIRDACPFRAHDPELDVQVAVRILSDRALYRVAMVQGPAEPPAALQRASAR